MSEQKAKVIIVPKPAPLPGLTSRRRVAAYARVSTSSDDQLNSLEAQKDYYVTMIQNRPEWEYCGLYADEGISGLQCKKRVQFQKMLDTALAGELDLIITKSISRFARNTVDSLTCIRALKAAGCEVYFEKENLWTFDGKGEFMLTLLSSMAQEESRSISENITWGQRKRFADGRYSSPYHRFLGYEHGMIVDAEQALIVRAIYRMALEGKSLSNIRKELEAKGIPSPAGGNKWWISTIRSILHNVKYKGDALLQKTFTTDYLQKKRKPNEGELPQYYVSGGHEPIIPPATFDLAQEMLKQREDYGKHYSGIRSLSGKVVCCQCGGLCCNSTARKNDIFWVCANKLQRRTECKAHYISLVKMDRACGDVLGQLLIQSAASIADIIAQCGLLVCADDVSGYITELATRWDRMITPEDVSSVVFKSVTVLPEPKLVFVTIDSQEFTEAIPQRSKGKETGIIVDPGPHADLDCCTCRNCGKAIMQEHMKKKHKFCSDACRRAWWNNHPDEVNRKAFYSFTCTHCGKPFTAYGNSNRRYCCHECYVADRFRG